MKKFINIIFVLLFYGCNNINTHNNERPLTPPPDSSIKHEIRYKGKSIMMNDYERKRFLDSLNMKDTIIGHLE
jgi:hypothetical protein